MKVMHCTSVVGIVCLTVATACAWQTPSPLSTWDQLDSLAAEKYASVTNCAAIFPPFFSFSLFAGFFSFSPEDEIAEVANCFEAGNILGVPVWRLRVTETQTTEHVWLVYGESSEEAFRTNAVPVGYNPDQWVEDVYGSPPGWLSGEAVDRWYRERHRSRLSLQLVLIASNDWPLYMEAVRTAATRNPAPQNPPPYLPDDTNRLSFAGVEPSGAQAMRLWLFSPPNRPPVDMFGSHVLPPVSNRWTLLGSAPAGNPFSAWDEPMTGARGFYCAARNDVDSDGDGIPDGREKLVFLTLTDKADTDEDGLSDLEELYCMETNPGEKDTDGDGIIDKEDAAPVTPGPDIIIGEPGDGETLSASPVTVSGWVVTSAGLDFVWVCGQSATIVDQGGGVYAFTNTVPFDDGSQDITVRAVSGGSPTLESKKSITVSVDAQPSDVTILSPADLTVFDGANVRVSVWSDSSNAVVTVNGISTTRDGFVRYAWVALDTIGTNTLEAMSVDGPGRFATDSVKVVCTDLTSIDPNDDDNDGVPNPDDPAPNDPTVRSAVVITFPPNGLPITVK